MNFEAYWISPEGNVIPVKEHHIMTVVEHPEKFGYMKEAIKKIYDKNSEALGKEGQSRDKIVKDLITNHGWVRVRFHPRRYMWEVELNKLNNKYKDILWEFFTLLTGNRIFKKQPIDDLKPIYEVRIIELSNGGKYKDISMEDALHFKEVFESHFHNEGEATFTLIEDYVPNNFRRLFE